MARHNDRGVGGRFVKGAVAIWAAEQERESQARRAPVAHNARFYGREVEMSPAYLMTRLAALAGLLVLVVGSCS